MTATLVAHSGARIVTQEQLRALPTPVGTPTFKPVPHYVLVETLLDRLGGRSLAIERMQLAVSANDMQVFGALDLGDSPIPGMGRALGFRAANDKSLSIQVVAGGRVFVCDNLSLSGQAIVLRRKHTRGLSLGFEINAALDRYVGAQDAFEMSIEGLVGALLTDQEAKARIFDLAYTGVVPGSLFDEIGRNYFEAASLKLEDCAPRTAWGLHNAATRAVKALSPASAFTTTMALGRAFGIVGS
jgi:hypothetical protein